MKLYETLGVKPTASSDEIKRAYRAKAKQHHPDAGGTADEFQAVSLAYEVLSCEVRRKRYDSTGSTDADPMDNVVRQLIIEGFSRSDWPIRAITTKLKNDLQEIEQARGSMRADQRKFKRRLKKFLERNSPGIVSETIELQIGILDHEIKQATQALDNVLKLQKVFEQFDEPGVDSRW
jgi:curved DNA-binding protein CbpA